MQITWYIEDGYSGNRGRPHTVEVDDEELREVDSEAERIEIIEDAIQNAFNQTSWFYDKPDLSEFNEANED